MTISRISKDEAYIEIAYSLARRSTCIDKQVGCVITNNRNEIIATGYNGAPRGELHCIDLGYCIKEAFNDVNRCPSAHAEQNALLQCRVPEQIYTIYLTLSPCVSCMRIIMNTPCKRIVFFKEHKHSYAKNMWTNKRKGEWIHYGYKNDVRSN
jgi:dCMP deaminase